MVYMYIWVNDNWVGINGALLFGLNINQTLTFLKHSLLQVAGQQIETIFCYKIRGPQMWPQEALEIFTCDSTKFFVPYTWGNGHQEFPVHKWRSTEGMEVKPEELSFFLVYDGE